MDFQLTPPAANWEASLFPAQFTNDKIAPPLAQRQALFRGHDPGGFSSVCNTQVDNWQHMALAEQDKLTDTSHTTGVNHLASLGGIRSLHRKRLKKKV